jgi:hypothetical protein
MPLIAAKDFAWHLLIHKATKAFNFESQTQLPAQG